MSSARTSSADIFASRRWLLPALFFFFCWAETSRRRAQNFPVGIVCLRHCDDTSCPTPVLGLPADYPKLVNRRAPVKPRPEQQASLRTADDHITVPPSASLMITVYCQDAVPNAVVENDPSFLLYRGVSIAVDIFASREENHKFW